MHSISAVNWIFFFFKLRNIKQYILINYDWRLELNEKVALFALSKAEDAEIRK